MGVEFVEWIRIRIIQARSWMAGLANALPRAKEALQPQDKQRDDPQPWPRGEV